MGMSSRCVGDSIARFLVLTGAAVIFFLSRNELEAAQSSLNEISDHSLRVHEKYLLFSTSQKKILQIHNLSIAINLPEFKSRVWPSATIYYKIHPENEPSRSKIENSIRHWEKKSNLIFNEVPYNSPFKNSHLIFRPNNQQYSCKTYFGLSYEVSQPQPVFIGKNCNNSQKIALLIGYSIGILHTKDLSCMKTDPKIIDQYMDQYSNDNEIIPSFADLVNLQKIYRYRTDFYENRCNGKECENGGLLTQDCSCQCAPGTYGKICKSIYTTKDKFCGGVVSTSKLVELNTYPYDYTHGIDCTWIITPEEGNGVEIVVNDFDVPETPGCLGDHVSISTPHHLTEEKRYCGKGLTANDAIMYDADKNVIVKFRTSTQGTGRGFSFNVLFNEEFLELGTVSTVTEESL